MDTGSTCYELVHISRYRLLQFFHGRSKRLTITIRARFTEIARLVMAYMLDDISSMNFTALINPSRFAVSKQTRTIVDSIIFAS